mmetsp:Transcript_31522/g.39514  ORF Transcript_31522/g.39514 Transcript_31522/m.39514 type:complete len:420 (-) Transcript_31522:163-1422(-)
MKVNQQNETVSSLQKLCLDTLALGLNNCKPNQIPWLPETLRNQALEQLIAKKGLTDESFSYFLCVGTTKLPLQGLRTMKNSTLKQIGFLCPQLVSLDLSGCQQVTNSVIQSVLHGCEALKCLRLDRCPRLTDAAFHLHDSPFAILFGALSLEVISLQGCPQVTGELVFYLRKICRRLRVLNLSKCKRILKQNVQEIFSACSQLESLNLAFIDHLSDDAFESLPHRQERSGTTDVTPSLDAEETARPLEITPKLFEGGMEELRRLNLGRSSITDATLSRVASLRKLLHLQLPCCLGITDHGVAVLVAGCPNLQQLDLQNCGLLTDAAPQSLAQAHNLQDLNLSWCAGVTDVGVLALAEGICANSLHRLSLSWCDQLTNASVRRLSERCLQLKQLELGGCIGVTKSLVFELLQERGVEIRL